MGLLYYGAPYTKKIAFMSPFIVTIVLTLCTRTAPLEAALIVHGNNTKHFRLLNTGSQLNVQSHCLLNLICADY